jgi:tetratricopeptide (TPR) repeat protein
MIPKIPGRPRVARLQIVLLCMLVAAASSHGATPDPGAPVRESAARHADKNEYGVALAMGGETARAESVFVSLLSNVSGDQRALNNLGNLHLIQGEYGVSLAFYDRALRRDSTEAGVHLNRATALVLMGDAERAEQSAAIGVRLAGGMDKAGALLGLKIERSAEPSKAAGQSLVSKEEIRALLRSAAAAVPRDTTAAVGGGAGLRAVKTASTWRSAGPRGADRSDAASLLYWKR